MITDTHGVTWNLKWRVTNQRISMNGVNRMRILTRSKVKLIIRVVYNVSIVKITKSLWSIVTCNQVASLNMRLLRLHQSPHALSFVPSICSRLTVSLQLSSAWPLVTTLNRSERMLCIYPSVCFAVSSWCASDLRSPRNVENGVVRAITTSCEISGYALA